MIKKYAILTLILSLITTQSYGIFDKETILQKINDIKNMWSSCRYLFVADAEEKTEKDYEKDFVEYHAKQVSDKFLSNPQGLNEFYTEKGCDDVIEELKKKKDSKNDLYGVGSRTFLPAILSDMYNAYNNLIQKRLDDPQISSDIKKHFIQAKQMLNKSDISGVNEIIAPLLINELSGKKREDIDKYRNSPVAKVFEIFVRYFPDVEPIVALHNEFENYGLQIFSQNCLKKGYYKYIFGEIYD